MANITNPLNRNKQAQFIYLFITVHSSDVLYCFRQSFFAVCMITHERYT